MKELLISIFGMYEPVVTQEAVTITAMDGTLTTELVDVVAAGAAGLDWPWLAGVALFALVLYSFFRLVGVLLNG